MEGCVEGAAADLIDKVRCVWRDAWRGVWRDVWRDATHTYTPCVCHVGSSVFACQNLSIDPLLKSSTG